MRTICHAERLNSTTVQNLRDGALREVFAGNITQDEMFRSGVFRDEDGGDGIFVFSAVQSVNAQPFDAGKILDIDEWKMMVLESAHMCFLNGETAGF